MSDGVEGEERTERLRAPPVAERWRPEFGRGERSAVLIRNHFPDFWNLVTAALPDAQTRRQLRETAPRLPF